MHTLVIGNKNYSSWSLRPWLLLKVNGIPFKEVKIPLYIEESKEKLLDYSPTGKVPALIDDDLVVWDSLSICEYVNELYPDKICWPEEGGARSVARSISNEMHSSFFAIRNELPMNCRKSIIYKNISSELEAEIKRICDIWRLCRSQFSKKGEYLFGDFTIADAMYAPIVLRFNSYGIPVGDIEQDYMNTILETPSLREWVHEGKNEEEYIADCEVQL